MPTIPPGSTGHRYIDAVIDTINCGLIGRDTEGFVNFANDRLLAWLGYEREDVVGIHFKDLVPPDLALILANEIEAVDAGDVRARLTTLQRKDGTTFPVLIIPQRLFDDNGEPAGGFGVIVDMGMVQTAKRSGDTQPDRVRASLERIAMELQSISLTIDLPGSGQLPVDHSALAELTDREKEVLHRILGGQRVPSIAKRDRVSQHTVRSHLKAVFRKLGVNSQAELIEHIRTLVS